MVEGILSIMIVGLFPPLCVLCFTLLSFFLVRDCWVIVVVFLEHDGKPGEFGPLNPI